MIKTLQTLDKKILYVLRIEDKKLRDFVLNEISYRNYFTIRSLRKQYISDVLDNTFKPININNGIGGKIGRIFTSLNLLGLIVKSNSSTQCSWKNLYKDTFFNELGKRLKKL